MNDFSVQVLTKTKTKIVKNKPTTITEVVTISSPISPVADNPTISPTPTPNKIDALNVWEKIENLPTSTKIVASSGVILVLFCLLGVCIRLICRKKRPTSLTGEARQELGYPLTPPVPQTPRTILRQRYQKNREVLQQNQNS